MSFLTNNSIKEKYNNIKTPEDLLKFMDLNIKFGFIGNNKRLYDSSDLDSLEIAHEIYWNLSSPSNTLKTGFGNCFDQVELERDWFTKNGYECKTLYISFLVNGVNSYPTIAYLVYKNDDKWCWFEHYDKVNYGIHEYDSLEELITDQMTKHVNFAQKFNPMDEKVLDCLHIFEYKRPKYNINKKEFTKFILSSTEVPIVG